MIITWMVLFFLLGVLGTKLIQSFIKRDPLAAKNRPVLYQLMLYMYLPMIIFQLVRTAQVFITYHRFNDQAIVYIWYVCYFLGYLVAFKPTLRIKS